MTVHETTVWSTAPSPVAPSSAYYDGYQLNNETLSDKEAAYPIPTPIVQAQTVVACPPALESDAVVDVDRLVEITAPSTLSAGYTFDVLIESKIYNCTVVSVGVRVFFMEKWHTLPCIFISSLECAHSIYSQLEV